MLHGLSQYYKDKKSVTRTKSTETIASGDLERGVTLMELMMSVILLSVIFLAVSALYVSSQKFYYKATNEAIIAEELSYAIEHINKTVMKGMGTGASVSVSSGVLSVEINNNVLLDSSNYADTDTYEYELVSGSLQYVDGVTSAVEDLCPKITVTNATFSVGSNELTVSLEGSYVNETVTLYSSSHPRLTTFN